MLGALSFGSSGIPGCPGGIPASHARAVPVTIPPVPLLLAGIDEAGYGPTLGPLCVGFSVFRIHGWNPGDTAPCLWRLCKSGLCRKPGDSRKRVPIADSKALKLPNDVKGRHPLLHLERGALAMLRCLGHTPASDVDLLVALQAAHPRAPWYGGEAIALPLGSEAPQIAIAGNRVASALESGRVELVDARCILVAEAEVNEAIRRTGTKAEATVGAVGRHLRHLLDQHAAGEDQVRIVCDQLGGRTQYEGVLARELPGHEVLALSETDGRSRYTVSGQRIIIQFMPEAESHHLPVALASMIAKLTRELAMMRFNRYFAARMPEIKPTAGYYGDAGRWLREMGELITADERAAIVRRA
jgi:hypothetical protein